MGDSRLNRILNYLEGARDELDCERPDGGVTCLEATRLDGVPRARPASFCGPCLVRGCIDAAEATAKHWRRKNP